MVSGMRRMLSLSLCSQTFPAVEQPILRSLDELIALLMNIQEDKTGQHLQLLLSSAVQTSIYYYPDVSQILLFAQLYQQHLGSTKTVHNERFLSIMANFAVDWPMVAEELVPLFQFYCQQSQVTGIEAKHFTRLVANCVMHYQDQFQLSPHLELAVDSAFQFLDLKSIARSAVTNLGKLFRYSACWKAGTEQGIWPVYHRLRRYSICQAHILDAAEVLGEFPELAARLTTSIMQFTKDLRQIDLRVLTYLYSEAIALNPRPIIAELKNQRSEHRYCASQLLVKMIQTNPCNIQLYEEIQSAGVAEFCKMRLGQEPYFDQLLDALREVGLFSFV